MKTLTIEHIASYLPYELYCLRDDYVCKLHAVYINFGVVELMTGHRFELKDIKPILVPLDKLTDAQYAEVGDIITGGGESDSSKIHMGRFFLKTDGYSYDLDRMDTIKVVQYLHSLRCDIYGLIPEGLAISALDLPENPYL